MGTISSKSTRANPINSLPFRAKEDESQRNSKHFLKWLHSFFSPLISAHLLAIHFRDQSHQTGADISRFRSQVPRDEATQYGVQIFRQQMSHRVQTRQRQKVFERILAFGAGSYAARNSTDVTPAQVMQDGSALFKPIEPKCNRQRYLRRSVGHAKLKQR